MCLAGSLVGVAAPQEIRFDTKIIFPPERGVRCRSLVTGHGLAVEQMWVQIPPDTRSTKAADVLPSRSPTPMSYAHPEGIGETDSEKWNRHFPSDAS